MDENLEKTVLARSFEESRAHLRAVAYRMLGSLSEADDAIQETWLKLSRTDAGGIDDLRAWLTTVIARVCLDMLRSRKARREDAVGTAPPESAPAPEANAEQEAVLADSVGLALLVVLEALEPAERLAFVLHDLFGVSFEEIAPIVGRSPVAARQLASRARRRVRGAPERDDAAIVRQRDVVSALLRALRAGDVEAVVAVLDPNVVVHATSPDGTAREIRGARAWATSAVAFSRAAQGVQVAMVDGAVGLILAPRGRLRSALRFTFSDDRIVRVEIVSEPARVQALAIALPDGPGGSPDDQT